ncbi:MAG: S-adenosylmethionine:tRNA ribosyltransferase-isomerase, partial [Bacteroidetes bacterium]|nr:S-adenosylmethionine:tRNA ribosyltransferase-isomerase [Bacteroidota bacterium]
SKWKPGQILEKKIRRDTEDVIMHASFVKKQDDYFLIELSWQPQKLCFAEILHFAGIIPLPPYIKRKTEISDSERYQTVYAKNEGSVAAPTAGLHFTDHIFQILTEKHILKDEVTLHVGAGTFMPVKSELLAGHHMHSEFIEVGRSTIESLIQHCNNYIIPIGTTSLRTIESLYWMGVKTMLHSVTSLENLTIHQWDAYTSNAEHIAATKALQSLLDWMEKNNLKKIIARTQLLIVPGYEFKITNALVTNFHQPQSTLLLLVAALIGDDWRKVYDYALHHAFRFLSYGDGCLLFGNYKCETGN